MSNYLKIDYPTKYTIVTKIVYIWSDQAAERDYRKVKTPAHFHWAVQFTEITRNISEQSWEEELTWAAARTLHLPGAGNLN